MGTNKWLLAFYAAGFESWDIAMSDLLDGA